MTKKAGAGASGLSEKILYLRGLQLPAIPLTATNNSRVNLAEDGLTIVYAYPRISPVGGAWEGWDAIPGARGCTAQSCGFRDHYAELKELGVERLFGLSAQDAHEQKEAVQRLHLPFSLLSDPTLSLSRALKLPLFEAGGMTLIQRLTLVIYHGRIEHVFYPVPSPEHHAAEVLRWLKEFDRPWG